MSSSQSDALDRLRIACERAKRAVEAFIAAWRESERKDSGWR